MRTCRIPWAKLREDYELGLITDDAELAKRYGCAASTIKVRRDEDRRRGSAWAIRPAGTAPARSVDPSDVERPTPAHRAPRLQPVPDAALRLPWTKYPRDPATARAIAALMEHDAKSELTAKFGAEAVAYFETQAAYLRAIADQSDRRDHEGGKTPHVARHRIPGMA